jgi:outer membrane protein OmpA-like peptidoglycan-associated protein
MNTCSSSKVVKLTQVLVGLTLLAACAHRPYEERIALPVTSQDLKTGAPLSAYDSKGQPVYAFAYGHSSAHEPLRHNVASVSTAKPVKTVEVSLPQVVHFAESSSVLSDVHRRTLRQLAAELKHSSGSLLVEGFTDPKGSREANYKLGLKRAHTVKNYLIQHGVASSRIEVKSVGETREPERKVVVRLLSSGKSE